MNFTTTHIRSEKVTIDTRIYTILNGRKKPGEVYLAAIDPDANYTEYNGNFEIPVEDEPETDEVPDEQEPENS